MPKSIEDSKPFVPPCQPTVISHTFWLDGEPVHLEYGDDYDTLWSALGELLEQESVQGQRALDVIGECGREIDALKDECLRHHRRVNLAQQAGVWEED